MTPLTPATPVCSLIHLLRGGFTEPPDDDPVVLAVVRGVLYALNRSNGQTKWAVRVGVDTTDLPVRVPAQVGLPERILVVSADAKTVTALDANGDQVWQYPMGGGVPGPTAHCRSTGVSGDL